jgi:hypothetical protein
MLGELQRKVAVKGVLFGGLVIILLWCAFLLGAVMGISRFLVLWAFFFILLGSVFAIVAVKLHKRSLYLFFATFFILVGFFLLLSTFQIVPVTFQKWWPLISVFTGLALLPSGWHRYGAIRSRYVVPSIAFVSLGIILLVFSLDMVAFSFKQFILNWWPLLIALAGLILVLISLGTRSKSEENKL